MADPQEDRLAGRCGRLLEQPRPDPAPGPGPAVRGLVRVLEHLDVPVEQGTGQAVFAQQHP
ncbi:hypothetical protein AB4039_01200 [Streptomyces sp. M-16]|uniref:hypothetical protein n=1 Tax=Streptomyces sp. M-16 TaxID=3233040 RepID=UPI0022574A63